MKDSISKSYHKILMITWLEKGSAAHKSILLWISVPATAVMIIVMVVMFQISEDTDSGIAEVATHDPSCDIQERSCEGLFADGSRVVLTIQPRPIEGLKPLQLEVELEGLNAISVEVDFRGLGMYMGYNRALLQQVSQDLYSGQGMLSVCTLKRMLWEATVLVSTDDGIMAAPFQFATVRR